MFSKKGLLKNYGSYSLIPLILIHFIIIILFYCKNFYRKIEKKIEDISYGIKNWYLVIKEEKDKKEREMLKKLKEQKKWKKYNWNK